MLEKISFSIDCYQCGTKLELTFITNVNSAEYQYCPDCQEGVQVHFVGEIIHIDRLEQE